MTANGFLSELQRIIDSQPKRPDKIFNCENCSLSDELHYSRNVMYGFDSAHLSNSAYLYDSFQCDNCVDCEYAVESTLCYESVDPFKAFNCDYINYSAQIRDSSYCHWCWRVHDLFGCVYLVDKSYCIFNRQLTKEEYEKELPKYKALPPEKVLAMVEELKNRYPLTQTIEAHNENSDFGNYVHHCKHCYLCFDAAHDENSCYLYDTFDARNSLDMTYTTQSSDLSYQTVSSAQVFNSHYIVNSLKISDSSYIINSLDLKYCLGCVGLAHKQYCILNRQFSKDEYQKISASILKELNRANTSWGTIVV